MIILLSSCTEKEPEIGNEWIVLPDLNGLIESKVNRELDSLGVNYQIEYHNEEVIGYYSMFIMYKDYHIDDIVNKDTLITVIVYPPNEGESIVLPDLTGLSRDEIIVLLRLEGLSIYFVEEESENEALEGLFIEYDDNYQAGDTFFTRSAIGVVIYKTFSIQEGYFEPIDMEYMGPYLSESFADINYINPRGGYFEVTLSRCTDGDTAKFIYPNDIYEAIRSSAKSVRFLNMDTEETYYGGEEEWGKPASVYTCGLLQSAESIILQTDPGDSLLDTYGRLLAWIWIKLPGEDEYFLLNYMVVAQGLAQVKYEFGGGETISYGDYTYNEWMHQAEDYAIENKLGQWSDFIDYYWDYEENQPNYDRWY